MFLCIYVVVIFFAVCLLAVRPLSPRRKQNEKRCPNTFACIIKNVLEMDFIIVLSQYDCCHCLPRTRTSVAPRDLLSFSLQRRQCRISIVPDPFAVPISLVSFIFFFCSSASYSKHIIHIKLPNDFLLNASVCMRKEKTNQKKIK